MVSEGVFLQRIALVLSFVFAVLVVRASERSGADRGSTLRRRFVSGVPWGTLVSALFVLSIYLFVQGGLDRWGAPLVLPFRAWSYLYPLGMATAAFSHAGPGHLLGNLVGTLTLAPLAEYAWGHFPRRRGSSSFGSLRTNPLARAFLFFPAAVIVVGVATAAFAVGPVVGFSGVVFAFAGFALVYYPLGTVIALSAGSAVNLAYDALSRPTITASGHSTYATPWFANVAVQVHAIGLLFGLLLGVALAERRGDSTPSALRVWVGTLLFAVSEGMWALYWYLNGDTYVLFRAVGAALVVTLAAVVAAAVRASDRPLRERGGEGDPVRRALTRIGSDRVRRAVADLSPKRAAVVVLLLTAAALSGVAVPVNLFAVSDDGFADRSVEVRGYEVTYAENVRNGMVPPVDVEAFGQSTDVTTSGVIVRNPDRGIWTTAVPKGRLAHDGRAAVPVGGVGWREPVVAVRDGWNAVGGGTAYRVSLSVDGRSVPAYTSEPATAEGVVDGWNVSIAPEPRRFFVVVSRGDEVRRAPLPEPDESATVGGIRFVREDRSLYAVNGDTRVPVASEETYG